MKWAGLLASMSLVACTAANPSYTGGGAGGGGGGPGRDLGRADDLSRVFDLGRCQGNEHACLDSGQSALCENGVFMLDRTCPPASQCADGYCAPPAQQPGSQIGHACDDGNGNNPTQARCIANLGGGLFCQPFVLQPGFGVRWFCAKAAGPKTMPTSSCKLDSECASGLCGSNGECIVPCVDFGNGGNDCVGGGRRLNCVPVTVEVEQHRSTPRTCM